MILDKLIESSKIRVEKSKELVPPSKLLKLLDSTQYTHHSMEESLLSFDGVSIIAEIKKASPSKGLIRADFDHMAIGREYAKSEIQGISILTEPEYFKGDISFVRDVRTLTDKPILRKDFIVDEYQIYEARLYGADCVLLIMAALNDDEYASFYKTAEDLGLDVLTETHNSEEVKRAAGIGRIMGVNNRNLQTFEEDITTCERLLKYIPSGTVTVAESAVRTHEDFEYLKSIGVDAALIGEAFMREASVGSAVNRLRYGE